MTDDATVEQLIEHFLSGNISARVDAGFKLRDIAGHGDEALIDHLIQLLQSEDYRGLWWHIPAILSASGNAKVVQPLIDTLRKVLPEPDEFDEPGDSFTRKYIGYALAILRPREAVDVLIKALHSCTRLIPEYNDDENIYDELDHEAIEAAGGALSSIGDLRGIIAEVDSLLEQDHYHQIAVEVWSETTIEAVRQYLLKITESDDAHLSKKATFLLNDINFLLSATKNRD